MRFVLKKLFRFKDKEVSEDVFIHFSKGSVSDFSSGVFKVKTQGRVYCMRLKGKAFDNPTKTDRTAKSALIFRGSAAQKFKKHNWLTIFGYKRLFGQFVTSKIGDIAWDVSSISHDVIEISDFNFIGVPERSRRYEIFLRVAVVKFLDILIIPSIVVLFAISAVLFNVGRECLRRIPNFEEFSNAPKDIASWSAENFVLVSVLCVVAVTVAFLFGRFFHNKNSLAPGIKNGLKGLGYIC